VDTWGTNYGSYSDIGQILKVTSKNGATVYFCDSLHLDFRNLPVTNADWNDLNPRIFKFQPDMMLE
jgi:hypothetical protein